MKKIKIIRKNYGWYHRRHGILLDPLPIECQRLLLNHIFIRDIAYHDQTLRVLFHIVDMEHDNKMSRKWWWNPYTQEVTLYKDIVRDSNYLDWNCAICNTIIKSEIGDFEISNFCCGDCYSLYSDNKIIDKRILESSVTFTEKCAIELKKEQKNFLSYTKQNAKAKNLFS